MDQEPVEPSLLVAELTSRIEEYESRIEQYRSRVEQLETRIEQYDFDIGEYLRELETLNEALESRTVIGRATGLLAAGLKRPIDEAWDVMRQTSSYANVKLRHVAHLLVLAHDGAPAPGEEQIAARIARALERATGQSTGTGENLSSAPPPG